MRYSSYLSVFITVLFVVTACGKPPGSSPTPPSSNNNSAIKLPDEPTPRCASVEQLKSLKNAQMLKTTWSPLGKQLAKFKTDATSLAQATTTYCTSSGQTDANYDKLVKAYENAYLTFKSIYPYNLKEYKDLQPFFETPLPLENIDSQLTGTLPNPGQARSNKKTYDKILGFPVVDYLIFHDKLKLQSTQSKYCELLKLNTELISSEAELLSQNMQKRYTDAVHATNESPKKKYLVEIAEKIRDSLKEISNQQKTILSDPTKINQLDSRYSKKSLLGIEAAVQSIRSIYEGKDSDEINFEKRLCLQDFVAYKNTYLDAAGDLSKEPTDRFYPFLKRHNGQIVHDDFRRVELLINEIKRETTLEEGYPNASTHPELKKKLEALNEQLDKLSNDLDMLFAKAINLVQSKTGDADGD